MTMSIKKLDTNSPHIYLGQLGYWGQLAVGRTDCKRLNV